MDYFCQLILLFSLFLLLFMSLTALFDTIHGLHCIISAKFYLCLLYFQQKNFNFDKISGSQMNTKSEFLGHVVDGKGVKSLKKALGFAIFNVNDNH